MTLNNGTVEELERRCFAVFDGRSGTPLSDLAIALLERQKKTWPSLSAGYAALEAARLREIRGDGWCVNVQFNPRRIVSSGANLDPESLRRRPCFLCPENLPPEQQAIRYRDDYLILCNPAPIFPAHWTIAHVRHFPQLLSDHLHFQAAPAGLLPAEEEILNPRKRVGTRRRDGVEISRSAGLGRGILVIEGKEEGSVAAAAGEVIGALGRSTNSDGEPLLNILCARTGEGWRLILFPRRKHRPDAYFREGGERRLISPGAVDMGGIIITSREEDFLAMTPDLVRGIFREVAFDDAAVDALLDAI